jgi:iron complex transport system substrate-binding protein
MDVDALLAAAPRHPRRIACLTEEPTETLYRLGCGDLVVGVSSFTLRPEAARHKPKVSSFLDANFDRLLALQPDLVIGFSDLQGDIAAELAKRGVPVVIFNQRSVAEILQTIQMTGALVGRDREAAVLVDDLVAGLRDVAASAAALPRRPKIFFEEWADPTISGIRWVSELIEVCGGDDVFARTRARHDAKGRFVSTDDVIAADPDGIIASWCGKKVKRTSFPTRYATTTAVRDDQLYEIPSELILQPGPAALTDGVAALSRIIAAVARGERLAPRPGPADEDECRRGDLGP